MAELILGDALSALIDHRGKTPKKLGGDFTDSGPRVVSALLVQGGRLNLTEARHVSQEMWQKWMKVPTRSGDVILTSEAPLGRCARIPDNSKYVLGQRVFGLRGKDGVLDSGFLYYALQSRYLQDQLSSRASGTTVTGIRQSELIKVRVPDPGISEQKRIASILTSLDDKIAVNERIAATARQLGSTLFGQAILSGSPIETDIDSVSSVVTRGVAPRYSESADDLVVLNQKCIRDGRVSLAPARLTLREKVKPPKLLRHNDVLVNSTGVGTLGRVGRWTSDDSATVDSHITIVRFDESEVDPVCAGFAMLRAQPEIEAMGEGSTGQTELRRTQLGALEITLPSEAQQRRLRPKLDALEAQADHALAESVALAALRDTLLPQLMSGRLRVKDAEKIVEDHT